MRYRSRNINEETTKTTTRIHHLMSNQVLVTTAHKTVRHVREIMDANRIHAMPVVDPDGKPVGIISTADLITAKSPETRVSQIMSREVITIPQYADVAEAARTLRSNRIHHLVVTHEKKVVGILSSFDLLQLLDDNRFAMKKLSKKSER